MWSRSNTTGMAPISITQEHLSSLSHTNRDSKKKTKRHKNNDMEERATVLSIRSNAANPSLLMNNTKSSAYESNCAVSTAKFMSNNSSVYESSANCGITYAKISLSSPNKRITKNDPRGSGLPRMSVQDPNDKPRVSSRKIKRISSLT